ncbi:MAG: TorF family putative porin [Curvibacter sp.]|jgi:uncharacterized protein (TIGR02001 family)
MKMKSKIALTALALTAGSAAFAQLSYNVGVVSDYRVRGIAQTAAQPSLQGGVDYAHKSGAYVGAWAANNIKWIKEFNGATKGDYEIDVYGGYKAELMPGLSYDVGAITYQFPNNNSAGSTVTNATTYEIYGALTYKVVTLKYNQSVGDFLGIRDSNGSRYWDLSATFDLGSGFTLVPHLGRQTIPANAGNAANNADYTDYALTLTKQVSNGLTVSLAAVGTNGDKAFWTQSDGRYIAKEAVVVGVKYVF